MRASAVILVTLVHAASADPMRALPQPSDRAPATGPVYHVDAKARDDGGDGSAQKPYKTIALALKRLHPGDTLYLHGGVYFEAVVLSVAGTASAPITIRSAPGELAVIDGGLREFFESPSTAWEPVKGGAPGELESTKTYPSISRTSEQDRNVWVTGNFADTMIPLHGYKFDVDLRSANEYWNVPEKGAAGSGIYVGPGVWFDWATQRIHVRLAHTTLKSQHDVNYRGETDARKVPLVIGVDHTPLRIDKAKHVRLQDLVVRGSATHTVDVLDSDHVELDRIAIYGGSPALYVRTTANLRVVRSVLRGLAAPWSSRASMKYRGDSPYLFISDTKGPPSHDWELAYDEFTDSHDGLVLDNIKTLRFHHNRIDNFNDDGLYLTLPPRTSPPEDVQIYENVFSRTYTTFAFAEHHSANTVGSGVYIFRNIFDLRVGSYGWPAKDAAADAGRQPLIANRLCGDHGSPTWEPLFFYNNTVLFSETPQRENYGLFIAIGTRNSKRRIFNNIFFQTSGTPGTAIVGTDDVQIDGNLLWSATGTADFLAKHRSSGVVEASKRVYPPGWSAHDIAANPKFVDLNGYDLRLDPSSPAVDAGVPVPTSWPDPLRSADRGKPDIGALPLGAAMLRVGPAAAPH